MQFLAKDNDIKVIECNLRASRSMPFVSKVLRINFVEMATRIMLGEAVEPPNKSFFDLDHIGIKASQFSFTRLSKADPILGVEMASTGEVGCIGNNFHETVLKAMLSVGYTIPRKNIFLSTGPIASKADLHKSCRLLAEKGYQLYATPGSARFLEKNGVPCRTLYWPDEDRQPNSLEYLRNRKIDLVINIPKDLSAEELDNDYAIRRHAIDFNIPLIINARLAEAFITAFCHRTPENIAAKHWMEY